MDLYKRKTVGIIGLGFMGMKHLEAAARLKPKKIACADIRKELLETASRSFGNVLVYESWRELLEKEPISVLIIATYGPTHAEITVAAAERKIPIILCEKPMATSLKDADRMIEVCAKTGSRLFINFSLRVFPAIGRLIELIRSGRIGRVKNVTAVIGGARGLGCVGSHYVDLMRLLTKSDPVSAWGRIDHTGTPNRRGTEFKDPGGHGTFEFENGARGMIEMGEDFFLPPLLYVFCERGRVEVSMSDYSWNAFEYAGSGPVSGKELPKDARFDRIEFDPGENIDLSTASELALIDITERQTMATGEDGRWALEMIFGIHASDRNKGAATALPLQHEREIDIPIT